MPGSVLQSAYSVDDTGTAGSTFSATLSGVTAGSALVAFVAWGDLSGTRTCTVSDGTSYTADPTGKLRHPTDTESSQVFYLENAGAGSHTITATFNTAADFRRLRVFEIAGIATSGAVDGSAGQVQSTVGTTTDSISSGATSATTNANDFVLGLTQDTSATDPGSGTMAAGTGFTLIGSNQILAAEYKNVTATGAQTATFTDTKNSHRTTHVLVLKTASAPQLLAPASDVSAGAWSPSTGATLAGCLDETAAADADYIRVTSASTCTLQLATGGDPASSIGHILRYRLMAGAGNVTVVLKQGTTTIASFGPHALGVTPQDFAQTLSGAQADAITDYTNLRVDLTTS